MAFGLPPLPMQYEDIVEDLLRKYRPESQVPSMGPTMLRGPEYGRVPILSANQSSGDAERVMSALQGQHRLDAAPMTRQPQGLHDAYSTTRGLNDTLAQLRLINAGEDVGGASPEVETMIGRVGNAYQPMQDAAQRRMAPRDTSGLLDTLGVKLTQYEDDTPDTWKDVSAGFADRFPELRGAGRDYGAFISRMGEDGEVHNYTRPIRPEESVGPHNLERVQKRGLNVMEANAGTRRGTQLRKERMAEREANRAAMTAKREEQNEKGALLSALMGRGGSAVADFLGSKMEAETQANELGRTSDLAEIQMQINSLAEALKAGVITLDTYKSEVASLLGGGEAEASPAAPQSAEEIAAALAEKEAGVASSRAAVDQSPEVAKQVADGLPPTASKEEIEAAGLTAGDLASLVQQNMSADAAAAARYDALLKTLMGQSEIEAIDRRQENRAATDPWGFLGGGLY